MQAFNERPLVGRPRHGFQYFQPGRQGGPCLTKRFHDLSESADTVV
jgi:hypothetical protein